MCAQSASELAFHTMKVRWTSMSNILRNSDLVLATQHLLQSVHGGAFHIPASLPIGIDKLHHPFPCTI